MKIEQDPDVRGVIVTVLGDQNNYNFLSRSQLPTNNHIQWCVRLTLFFVQTLTENKLFSSEKAQKPLSMPTNIFYKMFSLLNLCPRKTTNSIVLYNKA